MIILGVIIFTFNILFEAVFRSQAEFDLTNNIKYVRIFAEEKSSEVEIAIFITKFGLHDVSSTNSILKKC